MSKAKIIIEFNGKKYRASKFWGCSSKRDCDLFKRGVCDSDASIDKYPCHEIAQAFNSVCRSYPIGGYREIKK